MVAEGQGRRPLEGALEFLAFLDAVIDAFSREVLPILGRQKVFLRKDRLESRLVVPKHDRSCLLLMTKKRHVQAPLEPIRRQRVEPHSPSPPRHPGSQGSPSSSAMATPRGAQFNSAAAISPSHSGVPPLGEDGLMKLVERFGVIKLGANPLLPENVREFRRKPDDFRIRLNTHLETNDLKKETEEAEGMQIIVVSHPAFDHVASAVPSLSDILLPA